MSCAKTYVRSKLLQKYLPVGLGLGLLVALCVLLLVRHGRRIMKDLANVRINRIKRRLATILSPSSCSGLSLSA